MPEWKRRESMGQLDLRIGKALNANRTEIKYAVEQIFGVKVATVNTMRQEGKLKRQGRTEGRRPERKKAYVTLAEGSKTIEFFEGMAQ